MGSEMCIRDRFKMLTTDHDKGYVVAAQGLNDAAGIGGGQPYVDQRTINFHGGNTNEIIEAYRRLGSATLNNAMSGIT